MSITIRIPTPLRTLTGGAAEVAAAGATVAEVLADLERQHPGVRARIMDEQGRLRRFVNLYLNDEDIRFLQGLDTPVPARADLSIIPAIAGGAAGAARAAGASTANDSCSPARASTANDWPAPGSRTANGASDPPATAGGAPTP
jgi:molybdopterin converting factor small subunit